MIVSAASFTCAMSGFQSHITWGPQEDMKRLFKEKCAEVEIVKGLKHEIAKLSEAPVQLQIR